MASKVLHFSLDISKLKFVLRVLRFHKFPEARWFDFGLNLGLLHPTLEAIESAHRGDLSRCLTECLTKWLTEADDNVTTVGPITWQTLANALREMELKSIADNIHKIMADPVSEILQCFIGRLAQVVLSEESVDLLHTEGVVSKATSTEVKNCGCLLVGNPMLLILRAVAEDHNKLCTLASILMKSKEAALLANEMIMEYGKSFPSAVLVIPPCKQASTSVAYQNSSTTEAQPQVTTSTDAAQSVVEVILHPGHKAEFDRMGDLLGILIDDIAPLIEASIPSLDKFKTYLGRCRRELKLKLKDADSFDDVMEVIEGECSIINIAFLETIVSKYSIQDAADKVLAYQTHLDEFCENNLTMFCNHQFKRLSSSLLTCETIKFVLKWNPSEHSLSDIKGLLWKTFKDNQVEVVVIEEGNSIIVTCYAPHYLMESLLLTARENLDVLKEEMGLISLTIGCFTVYDQHVIDEEVKSLMKKLEMVENEKNDLLEEIDTDSQKQHSEKKMKKVMLMEIEQLRSSLQNKTEEALSTRDKEIEMLQEKISLLNTQQLKEVTIKKDQSTQSEIPPKGPIYVAKLNEEEFDCPVCFTPIDPRDGIRLRGCLRMVCKDYLKGIVINSENVQINCPFVDEDGVECNKTISEREIREDPPNEEQAMFRGAIPMPEKASPIGGIRVIPTPQCSDHTHKVREIQFLLVAVEEVQQRKSPSLPPPPGWDCPVCTFKNLPYRPGCEVCNGPRPDDFLPPPNYMPTEAEKKFMNNNDQELRNFLELERKKQEEEAQRNYAALLNTDAVPVILNEEEFDCPVCYVPIDPGDGIRLRGCLHMVCKDCLKGTVMYSENVQINCLFVDDDGVECNKTISEREIREVLDDKELESYFGRGLRAAEATDPNSFMPAPQRSDHAHKVREIQPLLVAVEEVQQRKPPSPPLPPPSPPGWDCPSCTFKNLPYRPGYEVCNRPRPDDFLPPPNYMPTEAEKKFMNNNDQELRNFLELERKKQEEEAQRNYAALLNTDAVPVVLNEEEFDCPVCYVPIDPGDGIRLRGCLHMVCKDCLKGTVMYSENVQINCPFVDEDGVECIKTISERELREVLDDKELESYFGRGLHAAEATDSNSFHCKTADCPGFCFYEDEVNEFRCQNCGHTNCILCKAQHEDMNCQQYQDDLKLKAANDEAARETQKMLEDMVTQGEAMNCPQCKIIVKKKVGPDWIRCVMCKTEICWATKGPRWGPKGRGDITGGCKCGVNGARCHPNCRNCH